MKNMFILTGSGISAESGLATFRTNNGLWNKHKVEDVASIEGFERNPDIVHEFYNELRPEMQKAQPNQAHFAITMLQEELPDWKINVVTQNVDLLHEKAKTKNVYHMHGRIDEYVCLNCGHVMKVAGDMSSEDKCPNCDIQGMLKPHIVFFGEMPLFMDEIEHMLSECNIFIAIGTSGVVYPAAGFVQLAKHYKAETYMFNLEQIENTTGFDHHILGKASETFTKFAEEFITKQS